MYVRNVSIAIWSNSFMLGIKDGSEGALKIME